MYATRPSSRFLNSKVARRIFTLFFLCAIVPVMVLAAYALREVSNHLRATAGERLRLASRAQGQGIAERLSLLETELLLAGQSLPRSDRERGFDAAVMPAALTAEHVLGIARVDAGGVVTLWGTIGEPPVLTPEELLHAVFGKTVLAMLARREDLPLIYMTRAVDPTESPGEFWVASLNPRFVLAGGEDTLPPNNDLCVFDHLNAPVFCTAPSDRSLPGLVREIVTSTSTGAFEWETAEQRYVAGYWSLPLAYRFHVARWTILLSESRESVVAPVARFQQAFPLVALALVCAAFLLSAREIRRILVPLDRLRDGTMRIGARNFESRVEVGSGDEFEELADSFNGMSHRLERQFRALATLSEVDRAILSTLDLEAIVGTVLRELPRLIACDGVNITLTARAGEGVPRSYSLRTGASSDPYVETVAFDDADANAMRQNPQTFTLDPGQRIPVHLAPLAGFGCERFVVLPLGGTESTPSGAITLGYGGPPAYDDEDLLRARQLADQVAIALANVHLLEDLNDLNWGTLTALARTVDAKSTWTAGHSERVTRMAMKIARAANLSESDLSVLHRGGLLHDIGKIAVPAAIIDKPGELTVEEFTIMKTHPVVGANILAPIGAYADAIPIVRQHHERWDGAGYPDGLAGKEIDRLARVLSVADCYDAVVSDRPYRAGRSADEALRTIIAVAGTQLDPQFVEAFLEVMQAAGHRRPAPESCLRRAGVASLGARVADGTGSFGP